jgi:dTDP-4-dehydrorhamnose 3,5-epimerase
VIDGVKIIKLTTHGDDRGFFREIFRFPEQFADVPVGQLSHSQVKEGVVKAWHGHVDQSQWNYVVSGQIQVALYDNREDSSTYKETLEFVVEDEADPIAYFFPPGVLHGYKCLKGPMQIIYVTSGVYDLEDEIRKANTDLNIHYKWQ